MHALEITTTVEDPADAQRIGEALLASGHVACVKLMGRASSHYWWHGTIEHAEEEILLALTTRAHATEVAQLIASIHPYEAPEIVARDVEVLEPRYAAWLHETLDGRDDAPDGS